jgi:hypothetical protein
MVRDTELQDAESKEQSVPGLALPHVARSGWADAAETNKSDAMHSTATLN